MGNRAKKIVQVIAAQLAWSGRIELVPKTSSRGHHPWRTPMTLDTTAAQELGYHPVGNALDLLADEVESVQTQSSPGAASWSPTYGPSDNQAPCSRIRLKLDVALECP